MERDLGIEQDKEGLADAGNLRRVGNVDDENGAALSMIFGEVHRFGLDLTENPFDGLSCSAVSDVCVERLIRQCDVDQHAHGRLLRRRSSYVTGTARTS